MPQSGGVVGGQVEDRLTIVKQLFNIGSNKPSITMNTLQVTNQQYIISIREFIKNLSRITDRPKEKIYTLVKNGKKVGTFIPVEYEDEVFAQKYIEVKRKGTVKSIFDHYKEISFTGGPKDLSLNMDKYLYGANK